MKLLAAVVLCAGVVGFTLRGRPRQSIDLNSAWQTVEVRDSAGSGIADHDFRTIYLFTRRHFAAAASVLGRPQFAAPSAVLKARAIELAIAADPTI